MNFGLGIDTGGTYTDAVTYDYDKNLVIDWTKTLTIKGELKKSIINAVSKFPVNQLKKIGLVSLSTTLATNAAI